MNYNESLTTKTFIPNVVIKLRGIYFSIRQPDSGLVIDTNKIGIVSSLSVNPTSIDPFRATTAVNSNSFRLLDKDLVITSLFGGNLELFQGNLCEIWIGRVEVNMDFSAYLKIQDTYISKVSRVDGGYTFQTKEAKDRLNTSAYIERNKLAGNILPATTIITLQSPPENASGLVKINDEFISYTGVSGSQILNCIRGEQGTVPASHELGDDVFFGEAVSGNPIDILLKLLVSPSGGGPYDTLFDGAGIDQSLVDVSEFESIRDEFFLGQNYSFVFYDIADLKKTVEEEILFPAGLRLRANNNSKIGLAILNKPVINLDAPDLNNDQLTKRPSYSVDENKIVNQIRIEWGFDKGTEKFLNISSYDDANSITQFGPTKVVSYKFKGIASQDQVDQIASDIFKRFSFPQPIIDLNTQMSASAWLLGEKAYLQSDYIPTQNGDLNFGESLEITQRAINFQTGDVRFQLQFTQFTGIRICFLAPSDTIVSFASQAIGTIGAGRGAHYRVGWKMRLYDNLARNYTSDPVNTIADITGDVITFSTPWVTSLVNNRYRISFADYDQVTEQQKRFCFISNNSNNFYDGKPPYQIVF